MLTEDNMLSSKLANWLTWEEHIEIAICSDGFRSFEFIKFSPDMNNESE